MYSALAMYMERPPTSRGIPALGCALSLRRVTGVMRSIASRMIWGPTEQLSPMTSTPNASRRAATSSGDAPNGVCRSVPIVTCAMTGSVASTWRAAAMACAISSRSLNVSRMMQIGAAFTQCRDLLGEGRARFLDARWSVRLQTNA